MRSWLISMLVLGSLGTCASLLPSLAGGRMPAMDLSKLLRAGSADNGALRAPGALAAQEPEPGPDAGGEAGEIMRDLKELREQSRNPDVINPVIASLLERSRRNPSSGQPAPDVSEKFSAAQKAFKKQTLELAIFFAKAGRIIPALAWFLPGGLLALGVVFMLAGAYSWAMACARLVFSLSKLFLLLTACAAVFFHIFLKADFLAVSPQALWLAPVAGLLASAAFMRIMDMNYPFWNEALSAMLLPVISTFAIFGWKRLAG